MRACFGAYLRLIFALLLSAAPEFVRAESESKDYNGFEYAMGEGTIGEIGSLYLKPPSFYLHPFNNDYMGKTDKYLTGGGLAGLLFGWRDDDNTFASLAITAYWRAIEPALRPKDGEPAFSEPIGVFADWMEGQLTYAITKRTFLGGLKLQLGVGYGDIHDHGIKNIHKGFHRLIGQPTQDLTYDDKQNGRTFENDATIAHILPVIPIFGAKFNWQTALGEQTSKAMNEYFLRWNAILAFADYFKLGFERKFIKQVSSDFYGDLIRHNRYESTFSMMLTRYLQPSIKFVSPYLKGDNVGQIYVDFVNLTVPF